MQPPWESILDRINLMLKVIGPATSPDDHLQRLVGYLQREFPGPYRMVRYQLRDGTPQVRLHFDDPEQEIEWHLRWS